MSRPRYELADVIERFGPAFFEIYAPNAFQKRVLHALSVCRTSALGGHKETCTCCGKVRISYNSCRNRHCPKCRASDQAFWVDDLLESILPVKHYHVVFTVPHLLNEICLSDSPGFYNDLFKASWDTLRTFGYTRFGLESGAISVLHTWGQNLSFHPHIHMIVPAAGLTLAGNLKHVQGSGKYIYPVKQLRLVFRGKLMDALKKRLRKKALLYNCLDIFNEAWKKKWVVYCEPSFGKPIHVVKYLGLYTHRVAISNQRILKIDDKNVSFLSKDYKDNAKRKITRLEGTEFLRRFCMHILPFRFVKIRRYGIYSSRFRALQYKEKMTIKTKNSESRIERLKRITGFDARLCPFCKKGLMITTKVIPRIRSPDLLRNHLTFSY